MPSGAPAERRSSARYRAGVALAAGGVLTGCGFGQASVEPHDLTPDSQETCAELLADLPDVVSDAVRREVRDEPDGIAAWGDPLIVLRCGVPLPPEYRPDALLTELNGVAWLDIEGEGGTFFATVDRNPIVEVAVPAAYAPESDVLTDLAHAITDNVPERPLR